MPRFTLKKMLLATTLIAVGAGALAGCGQDANRNNSDRTTKPVRELVPVDVADTTIDEPTGSPAKNVRRIPIPQREHGYKNFESHVLTTKKEFESFLNDVTQQPHWNRKEDFLAALRNATIDFQSEVLLLTRTTAGSGSIKISLAEPSIIGADIVFRVIWELPGQATADMNYQCFAVTIPTTAATNARIVTVSVPMPGTPRGRDLKIKPQVIPLSHGSSGKSP